MEKHGYITPNWKIEDFLNLEYKLDTHKDQNLLNEYMSAGHTKESLTLYNYFEPNPMPDAVYDYIKPKFSFLSNISIAVNLFVPGQFIPYHYDRYDRYIKVNNITDPKKIVRCIVMLEEANSGQFIEIDNKIFSHWKAGEWFLWENFTEHAFYNFSTSNRYALQITGTTD